MWGGCDVRRGPTGTAVSLDIPTHQKCTLYDQTTVRTPRRGTRARAIPPCACRGSGPGAALTALPRESRAGLFASGLRPVRMPVRLLRLVAARNVSRDFRSFRIRHACCGQRPLRAGVSGDRPFCAATARAARQSVRHPDLHAPMSSASASLSALSTFHSFVAFAFSCFASQSGTGCPALRAMRMRAGAHSLS